MKTRLFLTLFFAAALCFYGCTKTEIVEIVVPGDSTEEHDKLDGNGSGNGSSGNWGLEDDEYYWVPGDGTRESPYTASQAFEMVNSGAYDPDKGYYVKGIVSCVAVILSWYGGGYTFGYYMSEDGSYTEESDFFVDSGFALGGEYFTSQDALSAGDKVIVYGRLTIDVRNNDRREMIYGQLCYWNGETADVDESFGEDDEDDGDEGEGSLSGTAKYPLTVSQALQAIEEGTYDRDRDYYVRGYVSYILSSKPSSDGTLKYCISDDGSNDGDILYVESGYGLAGAKFDPQAGIDDCLCVGDLVVIYGDLYMHGVTTISNSSGGIDIYNYVRNWNLYRRGWDTATNIVDRKDNGDEDVCEYFINDDFKQYCLDNFDQNHNEKISYAEAAAVTKINCSTADDFAGIEYFPNLQSFTSSSAKYVYLRYNTELTYIYLQNAPIEQLYLSCNTKLTSISTSAFRNCTALSFVELPENLTTIDFGAFSGCTSLTSIAFPKSLTTINAYAFENCTALSFVELPENLTELGTGAFYGCTGLTSIVFPENLTSIPSHCLNRCSNLTSVVFPKTLATIGLYSFSYCKKLESVSLSETVLASMGEYAFSYCDNLTSITLPKSLETIDEWAFYKCESLKTVVFAEGYSGSIDHSTTFSGCTSLETVENLATVGRRVFYNQGNLTTVTFSKNNMASIGEEAFYTCENLTSVSFPENSVSEIGYRAFYKCENLTSITAFPSSLRTIGEEAFYYAGVKSASFSEDSMTQIGDYAFAYCSIESVSFMENSLSEIGEGAFYYASLESAVLPEGLTTIGTKAFYYCASMKTVSIPSSVTKLSDYAFYYAGLESVNLSEGLTSIGESTFDRCSSLKSVTLPESITTIGRLAFYDCLSLSSVTSKATTPPTVGSSAFNNINTSTLYVPSGSESAYADSDWAQWFSKITKL